MLFYGRLKNLSSDDLNAAIIEGLKQVCKSLFFCLFYFKALVQGSWKSLSFSIGLPLELLYSILFMYSLSVETMCGPYFPAIRLYVEWFSINTPSLL
jgi:hypothetical protein